MRSKGSSLLFALIVSSVMIVLALGMFQLAVSGIFSSVKNIEYEKASWIARAGLASALHDLRTNWFANEEQIVEAPFSGGVYKTAIIKFPFRNGYRSVFIISIGYYPSPADANGDASKLKRVCFTAEIKMASPADYAYYCNPNKTPLQIYDQEFIGPVYVSGDAVIGGGLKLGYFLKDSETLGPALCVYGGLEIKDLAKPLSLYTGLFFGMKKGILPVKMRTIEEFELLDDKGCISKNGVKGWGDGLFNPEMPGKDNEYGRGEYFIAVKKNGAPDYAGLDNIGNIDGRLYKTLANEDMRLFDNQAVTKLKSSKRSVDCRGAFNGTFSSSLFERPEDEKAEGSVYFNTGGFECHINDKRDLNYAPVLYLKYTLSEGNVSGRFSPVLGFHREHEAVKLDRNGSKFTVTYPFIWQNFRFFGKPGSNGKLLGRERYAKIFNAPFPANRHFFLGDRFSEDPDYIDRVSVVVYTGEKKEIWNPVELLETFGPGDRVFQLDVEAGTVRFGNGINGRKLPEDGIVTVTATREKYFEASAFVFGLDPVVNACVVDLSNVALLESYRCKRCEKKDHAVIYSEAPLIVYGNPSIPVTIFSEKDIYLGPVNTDYLDPADPELIRVLKGPKLNDSKAPPVGIITKGVLWYDMTLAPRLNAGEGSSHTAFGRFTASASDQSAGTKKNYILNKTALFSSFVMTPGKKGWSLLGGEQREGSLLSAEDGYTGLYRALNSRNYEHTIVGSVYKDVFGKFSEGFAGRFSDSLTPLLFYPDSFRAAPPPHMPAILSVEMNGRKENGNKVLLAEAILKKYSVMLLKEEKESYSGLEEDLRELLLKEH